MKKPNFVGIDGESFIRSVPEKGIGPTRDTIYNLMCASDRNYIEYSKGRGLNTLDCLGYLIDLANANPGATFVSFYFNYDVNNMLINLPPYHRGLLTTNGHCFMYPGLGFDSPNEGYKVTYIPKKIFTLERGRTIPATDTTPRKWEIDTSITVYDVWGFFQCGFSPAIDSMEIGTVEQRDFIRGMKADRHGFNSKDIYKITDYCIVECQLLVSMMDKLADALWDAGIELRSWHGAGAVGSYVMDQYRVQNHLYRPIKPEFNDAVLRAYFGGRIQNLRVGEFETGVKQYDLVSAYPWGATQLPDISDAIEWTTNEYIPGCSTVVYHLSWDIVDTGSMIGPFPFRDKAGCIHFPLSGEGYYWAPEVAACLKVYGDCFTIHEGYVMTPKYPKPRPFLWIEDVFKERAKLKREGNHSQLALKLALNSMYGKFCQGTIGDKPPKFQSYALAGLITSHVRARIFILASEQPDKCIGFSTDGVFFETDAEFSQIDIGTGLGQWEQTDYTAGLFIMPGVYFLDRVDNSDRDYTDKSRGFPLKAASRLEFIREWYRNGVCGKINLGIRSFVGMKSASNKRPWRSWLDESKTIKFWPSRGMPVLTKAWPPRYDVVPDYGKKGVSEPYRGKDYIRVADTPDDFTMSYDDLFTSIDTPDIV